MSFRAEPRSGVVEESKASRAEGAPLVKSSCLALDGRERPVTTQPKPTHVAGDGERVAANRPSLGVVRHGHQRRAAYEDEVARVLLVLGKLARSRK